MQHRQNKITKEVLMPYEKFVAFGAESLSDAELLAIILRTGTRNCSALQLAENVLKAAECGKKGLLGLFHMSLEQFSSIKGIGPVKAVKLKCITELSKRIASTRAWENLVFQKSGTVATYFMEKLRHRNKECVILMLLDSKGHLIKEVELSSGTVNMSLLSPREVFIEVIKAQAVQFILIHNHPSGDPTPSQGDISITAQIAQASKLVDIPLLDHIIIGDMSYISFKEKGLL